MTFANPLGFLALLALPAIVVIHLYHRRFPPLPVAGLHLWGVESEVRAAGRKRDRLPVTASLLLELLGALLLTLVLTRPQFGASTSLRHLVVVLDNSASMSSKPADAVSFRDAAAAVVAERMSDLGRRSVVTVILTGPRPVMLAGPAVPWEEAEPKLAAWEPRLPRHDFGAAWDLASQLADKSSDLLFVTDHLPPQAASTPARMEVVAVGRPLPNVAISAARWTFDSVAAKGQIFLRIDNHSSRAADVVVVARAVGRDVFRKSAAIEPQASIPVEAAVPGGLGLLDVEVQSAADGLALDSRVTLVEPQVRRITYAVALPKDDPAQGYVHRVLQGVPDVQPGDVQEAHLQFGVAGELPASRRNLWWLGIGPLDRSEEARKGAVDLADRTPYLLDKRHPLLQGISLDGIVWGGVQPMQAAAAPLISAGTHRLLAQLDGTQTTGYLLNIDLSRSNLVESPDWPILLSNLVELRRDNLPGLRQWNYRINEQIRFRLFEGTTDPSTDELQLWHKGETRPLARTATVEIPPLDDTGVYEIREGERVFGRFAANFFDPAESVLSQLGPGVRQPAEPTDSSGFAIDNPYSWLILLGLVAIIAAVLTDWRVLSTR